MKKYVFVFLSGLLYAMPLFATGIDANTTTAPCDSGTLGQTSGTANMEIDWQPNTIGITWYNDDTQLTVQNSAQSCVYDDDLYLPTTQPTKTGYTFKGWTVQPRYDFSTLPSNSSYVQGYGKISTGCYVPGEQDVPCDDRFSDLNNDEWKLVFNWGTIYGISGCSTTTGTYGTAGNPILNNGQQCWCKATTYKPVGSDTSYKPSNPLPWVFSQDYSAYNVCRRCAFSCGSLMRDKDVYPNLFIQQ